MAENVENATNTDDLMTLNQISTITGGNYQTVKKIVDRYVRENKLTEGVIYRRNRPFPAYAITHTQLAEIQIELKQIKKTSEPIKTIKNDMVKSSEKSSAEMNTLLSTIESENATAKMQNNVKIYEVTKENNKLENQVRMLEANIKDLEVQKTKEISALREEKTKFESELYKAQADLKLIEDKSKTMESAYAEQKQEVQRLQKVINNRNIALMIISTIMVIVLTVICTMLFVVK